MNTISKQIEALKLAFALAHGLEPNFLILGRRAYVQWMDEFPNKPFRLYDGMGIGSPWVHYDPNAIEVMRVSETFLRRQLAT